MIIPNSFSQLPQLQVHLGGHVVRESTQDRLEFARSSQVAQQPSRQSRTFLLFLILLFFLVLVVVRRSDAVSELLALLWLFVLLRRTDQAARAVSPTTPGRRSPCVGRR
jgi:hypothetical protein